MKNINIKQIAFTIVMGLFLSACGGSSSNTPDDNMVPECGVDNANAISVLGKTIEKIEDGAEVRILHTPDSTKLACMIKGQARIVD